MMQTGTLIAVIQGYQIQDSMTVIAFVLGYGMIKMPIKVWKISDMYQTLKYLQYKVAYH